MLAAYAGGPLDGFAAVVECPISNGRVVLIGTQPDDSWLEELIGHLVPGAKSDPGVMVCERLTADGRPSGAIIVNTRREPAAYGDSPSARSMLEGYGVAIVRRPE